MRSKAFHAAACEEEEDVEASHQKQQSHLECVKESYATKIETFEPLTQSPSAEDIS